MPNPLLQRAYSAVTRRPRGDAGYVLIVTIWITGLLAVLILTFGETVRSRTRSVAIGSDIAAAEALAEAGVSLAVLELLSASRDAERAARLASRSVRRCTVGNDEITYSIRDVAGFVDINFASEALLKALMTGAGVAGDRAEKIAAVILDYRDPDDTVRQGGAETAEYANAGLVWRPSNAPFSSTRELGRVLGMDRATLELLLPHITVHSQLTGIDTSSASEALIDIVIRGAGTDWTFENIGSGQGSFDAAFSPGGLPQRFSSVSTRRAWSVVSEARAGRARFARETIVELSPGGAKPYRLLTWSQIDSGSLDGASPETAPEPCG